MRRKFRGRLGRRPRQQRLVAASASRNKKGKSQEQLVDALPTADEGARLSLRRPRVQVLALRLEFSPEDIEASLSKYAVAKRTG